MKITSHKIAVRGGTLGSLRVEAGEKNLPLVYINGGPGGTYLDEQHGITALGDERDIVLYDQLGSYHSPAEFDMSLTPMPRFVQELKDVLDYYGIEKAIILGHSFGGTVALDFALEHPDRVSGLILSSPLIFTPRWLQDAQILLREMPREERAILQDSLVGRDIDGQAYDAAEKLFYARHVCRLDPWPARLLESFSKGNKEIYGAMWGRSEFTCSGTLKDYDRFQDLANLTMPVLLCCGRYDEARAETIGEAAAKIARSQFVVFEKSSHTAPYEEKDLYQKTIRDFASLADSAD